MSVEIGADPAPETYADEKEHRAMIARHSRSVGEAVRSVDERVDEVNTDINDLIKIIWVGSVTTTANSAYTQTTVTGVTSSDRAFLTPADGNAASFVAGYNAGSNDNGGAVLAACSANAVTILHPSFSGSGTFSVMVVRP